MGQHETTNAGLHFVYTNTEGAQSTVVNSSFHDCFGYCFNADKAHNVLLDNNVFYKGEKFLI